MESYFLSLKEKRVLFVGNFNVSKKYGTSIFSKRLVNQLDKGGNLYLVDSEKRFVAFRVWLANRKYNPDKILLNTFSPKRFLLFYLMGLSSKTEIIDHGSSRFIMEKKQNSLDLKILRFVLRKFNKLILVNADLLEEYRKNKIKLPEDIVVQHAFLPPILEEEEEILKTYPKELYEFINIHKPVLLLAASSINFYKGEEVYGIDFTISNLSKIKEVFPDVGLIISIGVLNNLEYFLNIKEKVAKLGLRENVFFLVEPEEIWPLMKKCDVYLRPNCIDGDSIAVRESLYLNCPVLASDVVERPEGSNIYKHKDSKDFISKLSSLLLK